MSRKSIFLREHEATVLSEAQFTVADGILLWEKYQTQVSVQFPSLTTGNCWILKPNGWVGRIPLIDYELILQPKIRVVRLFQLLFQLYHLDWRWIDGAFVGAEEEELDNWLDLLAYQLGKAALSIERQGVYQDYQEVAERIPYVRGRLKIDQTLLLGEKVNCIFAQRSTVVLENQLVAFSLRQLLTHATFQEKSIALLRQAYRLFRPFDDGSTIDLADFNRVQYHRLNNHYKWAHQLGYFFLTHLGPTYLLGEKVVAPFLLNMAQFYEQYVANQLSRQLPEGWLLKRQEHLRLGAHGEMKLFIDLLLIDPIGNARAVLDTKYKLGKKIDNRDVYQVAFYAAALGCKNAFLLYPEEVERPLDIQLEGVRVRTVTFSLEKACTVDWFSS